MQSMQTLIMLLSLQGLQVKRHGTVMLCTGLGSSHQRLAQVLACLAPAGAMADMDEHQWQQLSGSCQLTCRACRPWIMITLLSLQGLQVKRHGTVMLCTGLGSSNQRLALLGPCRRSG